MINAYTSQLKFETAKKFDIKNRGTVFVVRLDRDYADDEIQKGMAVQINGKEYVLRGVEYYLVPSPFSAGREIGLVVNETVEGD